jgi:hypothetical protein
MFRSWKSFTWPPNVLENFENMEHWQINKVPEPLHATNLHIDPASIALTMSKHLIATSKSLASNLVWKWWP